MQALPLPRTRRVATVGALSLLLLAGCSDDGGDEEASTSEGTEATTATTVAPFEVANTCGDIPESEGGAVNRAGVVHLIDFEVCQDDLTIEAGDAIEFVNNGATRHQIAHDPPGDQERAFRSDPMLTGDTFFTDFDVPGVYPYICSYHFEEMHGTITVE